ncbi:hypothetical protein [Lacinutrix algicola]|uniref:hypothetical protein n=1 Tax=Lacinutrix algicola TaxID=342954 RepID=UPI0006E15B8A|nr:hypothetical protein [Lacinutrix algicola]
MEISEKYRIITEAEDEVIAEVDQELKIWGKSVFAKELFKDDKIEFIKLFFEVRKNYINNFQSDFILYDKYIANCFIQNTIFKTSTQLDTAMSLFDLIVSAPTFEDKIILFKIDYKLFKTHELRFLFFEKLIDEVNTTVIDKSERLPEFKNFEIGVLLDFNEKLLNSKEYIKKNVGFIKELDTEIKEFYKETSRKDKEIGLKSDQLFELEYEVNFLRNKNETLKNYYETVAPIPVNQFNSFVWGDNYPALKVFFDFLKKNKMTYLGWSHFASLMEESNLEPIDIQSVSFSKDELGFLFYHLKDFFKISIRKNSKDYKKWIKQKFYVDGLILEDSFFSKNFRSFKIEADKKTDNKNYKKDPIKDRISFELLLDNIKKAFL